MADIIGVKFKQGGKVYYFQPNDEYLLQGTQVIVETARGLECGEVVMERRSVPDEQITHELKKVVRGATPADIKKLAENRAKEESAFKVCEQKILEHKLDMKLVSAEYAFDGSKILFYFTSDGRVDFRELVRDLASYFHTRIELRQIGVRDEAKMLGGLGICGRPFCCSSFMGDFITVSIKMAKEQGLSLNPVKISGTCGRLMCCLKYEEYAYQDLAKHTPKVGMQVSTPEGNGVVVESNLISGMLKVRMDDAPEAIPKSFCKKRIKPVVDISQLSPADAALFSGYEEPSEQTPEDVSGAEDGFSSMGISQRDGGRRSHDRRGRSSYGMGEGLTSGNPDGFDTLQAPGRVNRSGSEPQDDSAQSGRRGNGNRSGKGGKGGQRKPHEQQYQQGRPNNRNGKGGQGGQGGKNGGQGSQGGKNGGQGGKNNHQGGRGGQNQPNVQGNKGNQQGGNQGGKNPQNGQGKPHGQGGQNRTGNHGGQNKPHRPGGQNGNRGGQNGQGNRPHPQRQGEPKPTGGSQGNQSSHSGHGSGNAGE